IMATSPRGILSAWAVRLSAVSRSPFSRAARAAARRAPASRFASAGARGLTGATCPSCATAPPAQNSSARPANPNDPFVRVRFAAILGLLGQQGLLTVIVLDG